MDKITEWKNLMTSSLSSMLSEVGQVIPNIIAAIFILIIGWLLTKLIVKIIKKALVFAKADKLDDKLNDIEFFGEGKLKFNIIKIVTKFVKWVLYIILLILISDILNLTIISEEISNLLRYLPKLFTALIIFTFGLLLANFVKKGIQSFFESMDMSGSKIISQIAFIILLVFVTVTALNQAGVDTNIITSNVTLLLAGLLIAFALAFGLGSQKAVSNLLSAFYARKTYEIGQKIIYKNEVGTIESINNISMVLITNKGKRVIPIKDIVESEIEIQE
ncbi:hypothetical protein ACFS5M_08870 [Lacinutrix iliipiscaria]|uniref:Uncharacterized protein n=1 Tax=Lacinutrix iliipiscaria TaxID=1230532 RepID=A0ABW5WRG9_9FLAO